MGKRLFLIGNGFDLAHKLPTRYLDLLKWLYENDKSTFNNLNKLLLGNYDKKGTADDIRNLYPKLRIVYKE